MKDRSISGKVFAGAEKKDKQLCELLKRKYCIQFMCMYLKPLIVFLPEQNMVLLFIFLFNIKKVFSALNIIKL